MSASTPNSTLATSSGPTPPEHVLFGQSEAMQLVRRKVERVASTNVPVLIHGESGTGKEIVAKLIHHRSSWGDGPFVKVSCPAIPATLLESELFGYEKGAFTGANMPKPGRVELANRGTLFLDEIGELDLGLQAKLLQLLQDGQFSRIGAQEDKHVEVRVICSTNRSLEQEIESGAFRQDLFYRINVVNIELPPLRERSADIPEIASYFVEFYNTEFRCQARPVSQRILRLMQEYRWPGNIRELENLIKRYVILDSEEAISSELTGPARADYSAEAAAEGMVSLKKLTRHAVREMEKKIILGALKANNWNRRRTARALHISYRTLLYKVRQAGLPTKRARKEAEAESTS